MISTNNPSVGPFTHIYIHIYITALGVQYEIAVSLDIYTVSFKSP